MKIGHFNLAESMNGTGEHFVSLVEALDRIGIEQHAVVRNESLARRLTTCTHVTVGPVTATAVVACCLMATVDIVHAHDEKSAQSALLMKLTRSTPYVLTRRQMSRPGTNPLVSSIYSRASTIICPTEPSARPLQDVDDIPPLDIIGDISRKNRIMLEAYGNTIAEEHLRVYRRASMTDNVPALSL